MDVILILLACFGLTTILVDGKILYQFREWIGKVNFFKELIECSMCTGFWVGLYFSFVMGITLLLEFLGISSLIIKGLFYFMTLPFASSGVCWLLERLGVILDTIAHKLDD